MIWLPPPISWIKVNTDDAGLAGLRGIFRDHFGNCLGCFASSLGHASSLEAKLHALIHAMDLAGERGWNYLWIECECDSSVSLY